MDKLIEQKTHALDETNWWFRSRREIILRLIRKMKISKEASILDIGCAGGLLVRDLSRMGFLDVKGIDLSDDAVQKCRSRGIETVYAMDCTRTSFIDKEIDLITASDVLEHVKEDELALNEWYRILKPGGKVIIFVPAFHFLWSGHDEAHHHFRRYNRQELINKVEEAGFKPLRISFWNFLLLFPAIIVRGLAGRIFVRSREKKQTHQLVALNSFSNGLLYLLLDLENRWLSRFDFPFGVSLFLIAEKPDRG